MDINKKRDLEYIKKFTQITITSICKDLKTDRTNLIKGNASAETTRKVKEELKKRLDELNE
jgi:hypothetical protein